MSRVALALAALAAGSCNCANPAAQNGTALFVIVELNGVAVDQLELSISIDPSTLRRPADPAGPLPDPQTVRLLLPDSAAGQTVTVRVVGTFGKVERGAGDGSALVVLGLETEVRVRLQPVQTGDGGTDAGTCGPGTCAGCCEGDECKAGDETGKCGKGGNACQACASNDTCKSGACEGCNPANCNGCCRGSLCITERSTVLCGADGRACSACPPLRSDCSQDGTCVCGNGPPCPLGQRCKQGQCVCDALSCPDGCCTAAGVCRKSDPAQCGFSGDGCRGCPATLADTCSPTGSCGCGGGPQCAGGQACVSGACVCNAQSCPAGCCDGNVCRTISKDFCGPIGGACAACDTVRDDACGADGGCSCGPAGRRCGPDEHCTPMGCVCDALTCPNGCCHNGTCVTNPSSTQCGANGSPCSDCSGAACDGGICAGGACSMCSAGCCYAGVSCNLSPVFPVCQNGSATACLLCDNRSDRCSAQGCSCGGGSPCLFGQSCEGGVCTCSPASCSGCCTATGVCADGDQTARCGAGGGQCVACPPVRSDGCQLGQCRCGTGATCALGERCDGGQCSCDPALCQGCCSANGCVPRDAGSLMACGITGLCKACDSSKADRCSLGLCMCGTRPECGPGEQCQGGACVCNLSTGCTGCCLNNTQCLPLSGTNDNQCGSGGSTCRTCATLQRCSMGACCILDVLGQVCIGSG